MSPTLTAAGLLRAPFATSTMTRRRDRAAPCVLAAEEFVAMEFGMFHQFPSLPGRADADSFAEAFAQIDAAEALGLDVMWLAELHFDPQRSVLSAPLSIASAIAARTRRIKIGIAVQVLPLCHPLRLAEEAATVDQISHGRLIFGVGRSREVMPRFIAGPCR